MRTVDKMVFKTVVVVFCMFVFVCDRVVLGASKQGCILNVTNESTEKFLPIPLYNFTTHYDLAVPYKGVIDLKHRARVTIFCSGPKNYLLLTNSNITTISCLQSNTVQIFNKKTNFEDIQCKKSSRGEVKKTRENCGNGDGYIYKIGYQITKKDWVTLIDVCYVAETGTTLYTQHHIHGKAMKYASKTTYRPGFSTSGLNDDVTASIAYKRPYQKATFNKIMKSAKLADNFINVKSYLARGHLSPDADFLLATSQYSTYYYINTAPQWQGINGGNWKSIELTVRKLSEPYDNLKVITGTYGVLSYPDIDGHLQPVFLVSGSKIPVPKYFWKIVYDPDTQKSVVFVILNNPFMENVKESDVFCQDICESSGFNNAAWKKVNRGYVFCCNVSNFQNVVKSAPRLKVSGILVI